MVCMPIVCDNCLRIKLITERANRKWFILRWKLLSPIVELHRLVYMPVWDLERRKYSDKQLSYNHFRLLPPSWILGRQWSHPLPVEVVYIRSSFSTTFRHWNNVSIFCKSEIISTSGFAAMLTLTVENMFPLSHYVTC